MAATAGFVAADWTITRATGVIDYGGDDHVGTSPSYATVIEFHRAVADFADNATSSGDDQHDITDDDATDRSTDNIITVLAGYTITDAAAEHLYDGSIIQADDDSIWDGIVNFGNAATIQVHQNGAVLSDDWWNNDPFGVDSLGLNSDAAGGISHRFLIKVRNAGTDTDGRRLIGTSRTFGNTYSEFKINGTARGNNVLALSETNDLNNNNTAGDVSGWAITNTEGLNLDDVNNDTINEEYYSGWDDTVVTGTNRSGTVNDVYEYIKWATRDGSAQTIYGLNGELFRGITHEVSLNTGGANSGTFSAVEPLSWGSGATAGTGQMLAIDSTTASTAESLWLQLLTGVAPGNGLLITGGTSSATATTAASNATTERSISTPFLGSSTGSNVVGAFGVGFVTASLGSNDQVFDLTNTQRIPPNNVTVTFSNLDATTSNEDYLLVGPEDGAGGLDFDQLSLNTALTTDNITAVDVGTGNIPTDTPSSGVVRVADNNGFYRRLEYSGYDGTRTTFTITTTDGQEDFATVNASATNNVFIGYVDDVVSSTSENFTGVNINRTFFYRCRNAGNTPIKPASGTVVVNQADTAVSITRIADE